MQKALTILFLLGIAGCSLETSSDVGITLKVPKTHALDLQIGTQYCVFVSIAGQGIPPTAAVPGFYGNVVPQCMPPGKFSPVVHIGTGPDVHLRIEPLPAGPGRKVQVLAFASNTLGLPLPNQPCPFGRLDEYFPRAGSQVTATPQIYQLGKREQDLFQNSTVEVFNEPSQTPVDLVANPCPTAG
jgi:hypothetical protein